MWNHVLHLCEKETWPWNSLLAICIHEMAKIELLSEKTSQNPDNWGSSWHIECVIYREEANAANLHPLKHIVMKKKEKGKGL